MIQDYWGKIDGTVHYFSEDGTLRTGWIQDGRNWYFHTPDGEKQSSWMKEGQTWYYFKKSGRMSRGFTRIGQNWYYFDVSGLCRQEARPFTAEPAASRRMDA